MARRAKSRFDALAAVALAGLLVVALIGPVALYAWSYQMCDRAMGRISDGSSLASVEQTLWFTKARPSSAEAVPAQYARTDRPASLRWVAYTVPLTGDTILVAYDEGERVFVALPIYE